LVRRYEPLVRRMVWNLRLPPGRARMELQLRMMVLPTAAKISAA
jgi:hypothetical protein